MFKVKKSVGLLTRLRERNALVVNNVTEKFAQFEKRFEGRLIGKWVFFWKTVCKDYKEVAFDIVKECKEKPSKAILIGTTAALTTYFAKHNPNETHFKDSFIRASNELALVHHSLVKSESLEHVKYLEKCYNNSLIRYTSLGLVSFIWIDNHSDKCSAFENQCSYLQLKYIEMINRIVDIGFLDTWWMISKKMTDYDINY